MLDKKNQNRLLLVNEDKLSQKSIYELLCRAGYEVEAADTVEDALTCLDRTDFHLILLDSEESDSLDSIDILRKKAKNTSVIVLTSSGDLEMAVNCIKKGAFDYLARPFRDERILSTVERAISGGETPSGLKAASVLKQLFHKSDTFHGLVGTCSKSKEIYDLVGRIANSKTTILIQGESGTGKRLIAQAIHKADKKRCHKPFVEISCGALPREIIESELFGHTKGAFTGAVSERKGRFELAHGGTLLLDDIDSLPLDLQVKLLRVLQQKEFEKVGDHKTIKVDVRVIATTNQDIKKAVADKKFREDLYYRINVISVCVPPLRERKSDIPLLVEHFKNLYSKENHKKIKDVSEEAINALINYEWPGNIREIENIIERAIILDTDNMIGKDDLPEMLFRQKTDQSDVFRNFATTLKEALLEPEKVHIMQVLKEVGWNKQKAAKKLGVNRTTLYNKLRKYNIFSHTD